MVRKREWKKRKERRRKHNNNPAGCDFKQPNGAINCSCWPPGHIQVSPTSLARTADYPAPNTHKNQQVSTPSIFLLFLFFLFWLVSSSFVCLSFSFISPFFIFILLLKRKKKKKRRRNVCVFSTWLDGWRTEWRWILALFWRETHQKA